MNIPSNKKEYKVGVKTKIEEKLTISVVLAHVANGIKFKPFTLFKGAKVGYIYKNIMQKRIY